MDDARTTRVWLTAAVIATGVIALDQIAKSWAENHLSDRVIHVVGSLQLALTYNRGVAFGVASGVAPVLVAVAILGALALVVVKQRRVRGPAIIGVGLVLGGAVGNLFDRMFRGHAGAVIDFIDLQWWPVFNLADAAVVSGAVILVLWGSRKPGTRETSAS